MNKEYYAKKWNDLKESGFTWGQEPPDPPPDRNDPFPMKRQDMSRVSHCWIQHNSWTFKLNLKINVGPRDSALDIQAKRFNIYDKITHLRDMDVKDIVYYLKGVERV